MVNRGEIITAAQEDYLAQISHCPSINQIYTIGTARENAKVEKKNRHLRQTETLDIIHDLAIYPHNAPLDASLLIM